MSKTAVVYIRCDLFVETGLNRVQYGLTEKKG